MSPETARSGGWFIATIADIDVGHIGVVVFFLISGFVIPFSIAPDRAAPVGSFLDPPRSSHLSGVLAFGAARGGRDLLDLGQPFSAREVLVNLTLLQDLFGVRTAEGVYWTLLGRACRFMRSASRCC